MSKYQPLWEYMHKQVDDQVDLSFEEINDVLGFTLDHSFLNFKKELEGYGYRVKKIFLKDKKVTFEKYSQPKN